MLLLYSFSFNTPFAPEADPYRERDIAMPYKEYEILKLPICPKCKSTEHFDPSGPTGMTYVGCCRQCKIEWTRSGVYDTSKPYGRENITEQVLGDLWEAKTVKLSYLEI